MKGLRVETEALQPIEKTSAEKKSDIGYNSKKNMGLKVKAGASKESTLSKYRMFVH